PRAPLVAGAGPDRRAGREVLGAAFALFFFFSGRRRHTRWPRDWSSDVCSSDLLEVISKPGPAQDELHRFGRRVAEAVRLMAEVPVVRRHKSGHGAVSRAGGGGVGAIGLVASTGGPPALSVVLRGLPADLPAPVLIAQHIAVGFTPGLTRWLSEV